MGSLARRSTGCRQSNSTGSSSSSSSRTVPTSSSRRDRMPPFNGGGGLTGLSSSASYPHLFQFAASSSSEPLPNPEEPFPKRIEQPPDAPSNKLPKELQLLQQGHTPLPPPPLQRLQDHGGWPPSPSGPERGGDGAAPQPQADPTAGERERAWAAWASWLTSATVRGKGEERKRIWPWLAGLPRVTYIFLVHLEGSMGQSLRQIRICCLSLPTRTICLTCCPHSGGPRVSGCCCLISGGAPVDLDSPHRRLPSGSSSAAFQGYRDGHSCGRGGR